MLRYRVWFPILIIAGTAIGCEPDDRPSDIPTVDAFVGKLTHKGQPVKFADGTTAKLTVITDKGIRFGIPLKPDASFEIGWMPVGKYTVLLATSRLDKGKKSNERVYSVPGGLEIREGQTEYNIELGQSWSG